MPNHTPQFTIVMDHEQDRSIIARPTHHRAYILGSAHIYAEGRSPEEAVGKLVIQNPDLFGVGLQDHRSYFWHSTRNMALAPSHPDHQQLTGDSTGDPA